MQNMILQEAVLCCAVLCDKLEFICAERAVGAGRAGRGGAGGVSQLFNSNIN